MRGGAGASCCGEVVLAGDGLRTGIAEDLIGFTQLAKPCFTARLAVVRMIALCKQSVDAMNRFRLGVRADLKNLVVVRSRICQICRICRQRALPPSIRCEEMYRCI